MNIITDPADQDGPLNHMRLSALVWDPVSEQAVQHVNFDVTVTSVATQTVVFASKSLHEYDGHLELLLSQLPPALYSWSVKASQGGWTASQSAQFEILPPVVPLGGGPLRVVVSPEKGQLQAGVPSSFTIALEEPNGVLVPHTEVDFAILPASLAGAPLLITKTHSHDTPSTANITFPSAGAYTVRADGDSLEASAQVIINDPGHFGVAMSQVQVTGGPGLPGTSASKESTALGPASTGSRSPIPGAPVGLVAVAIAGAALVASRRR
jgi:hypothetical protein